MQTQNILVRGILGAGWMFVGAELAIGAWAAISIGTAINNLAVAPIVDYFLPRDSTDSADQRSGMQPLIDHGTGCEYLRVSGGGVTPRLGANGKQLCNMGSN